MKYGRIIQAVTNEPWALTFGKMAAIREVLSLRARGLRFSEDEIRSRVGEPTAGDVEGLAPVFYGANGVRGGTSTDVQGQAVAVLPVHGTLCHRMGSMDDGSGGIAHERVQRWVEAAATDARVGSIVLDFDSPGGMVQGTAELGDAVFAAREHKRVVAVANSMAASAAYWVATQAHEIVVTGDGDVGSIGVWTMHEDWSKNLEAEGVDVTLIFAGKHKVDGHPFEPLPEHVRAELQERVDAAHEAFLAAVARGRGGGVGQVRESFGQGQLVPAEEAIDRDMADRIGTLSDVISELAGGDTLAGGGSGSEGAQRAEAAAHERLMLMGRIYGGRRRA